MRRKRKKTLNIISFLLGIIFFLFLVLNVIHMGVVIKGRAHILELSIKDNQIVSGLPSQKADCILILGAAVWNGSPSPILKERLNMGAALYKAGASNKILLSGDSDSNGYNEVLIMEDYLVEQLSIPPKDITKDYKGVSTYESIKRAKEDYYVNSAIIVTQKYHLFRANYIASSLKIETYGADAQKSKFSGRQLREARECMARIKDFFFCLWK